MKIKFQKHFLLLAMVIPLTGMASCYFIAQNNVTRGTCVPQAVFAAWTWEQERGTPAQIWITGDGIVDHAQAYALVDGKYKPLNSNGRDVWIGSREDDRPLRSILTLQDILDEHNGRMSKGIYARRNKHQQ